jgi:hypothetical protein
MIGFYLVLLAASLNSHTDAKIVPASFIGKSIDVNANRGPAGRFPGDGCFGAEVSLRPGGIPFDVKIIQSARSYSLDRALFQAILSYRFSVPRNFSQDSSRWIVFVTYEQEGKDFRLGQSCSR